MVTVFLALLSTFCVLCGILSLDDIINGEVDFTSHFLIIIPLGSVLLLFYMYLLTKNNDFAIEGINNSLQTKEDYKFIVNKL